MKEKVESRVSFLKKCVLKWNLELNCNYIKIIFGIGTGGEYQ